MLSRIQKPKINPRALDLGCGSGRHSLLLDRLGWEVTAIDYSPESIQQVKILNPNWDHWLCKSPPYPIEDSKYDLVVGWGILHYNSNQEIKSILAEIQRILKPNGYFLGTIRSDKDTHLQVTQNSEMNTTDLKGGYARLFSLEDTKELLSSFSDVQIGYMERSPLGELDKKVSHYFFQAVNP
jgi:SAM-dependent methyltransferase